MIGAIHLILHVPSWRKKTTLPLIQFHGERKKLRLNFGEFYIVLVLSICVNLVFKPLAEDRLLSPTSGHFSFTRLQTNGD